MASESTFEIRDPVHATIRITADERKVVDSAPVQRLRYIRQLGLTYLVYPGANHSRFEHALGTMELAGRVFDSITDLRSAESIASAHDLLKRHQQDFPYWRRIVRLAALCHDVGHLPFSHTAEHEILPAGWSHERLTYEILLSAPMQAVWKTLIPPIDGAMVAKLAVGPKKAKRWGAGDMTEWESLLSEIITGDAFGVDRMDYLLRDSHHAGVAYGKIDHHRLLDTIRILPVRQAGKTTFTLGIRQGGLHTAEAMMMARYFMFRQVYCHPVSQIHGIYLVEFLKRVLPGRGRFEDLEFHQATTDDEVLSWLRQAATQPNPDPAAVAVLRRNHFKLLYEPKEGEPKDSGKRVLDALSKQFSPEIFRHQPHRQNYDTPVFPVLRRDDQSIESSADISELLPTVPKVLADYVYVADSEHDKTAEWLRLNRKRILAS